ncbi:MAG: nicotinate-nucleotide adenylyltransferase [Ignavibacteria bacterium]
MSKIGIFGGTFDPIHLGHLITTQIVYEKRKLDKIIFIPAFISPHKIHKFASSPVHRLNMLKYAIEDFDHFDISNIELNKQEISYTINTIAELKKIYDNIELIIGFDNLVVFDKWYKSDEIIKMVELIVMKRSFDKEVKNIHKYFGEAVFVDTPNIEISSTEIRDRVNKGLSIDFMVPAKVKDYIEKNNLYK